MNRGLAPKRQANRLTTPFTAIEASVQTIQKTTPLVVRPTRSVVQKCSAKKLRGNPSNRPVLIGSRSLPALRHKLSGALSSQVADSHVILPQMGAAFAGRKQVSVIGLVLVLNDGLGDSFSGYFFAFVVPDLKSGTEGGGTAGSGAPVFPIIVPPEWM